MDLIRIGATVEQLVFFPRSSKNIPLMDRQYLPLASGQKGLVRGGSDRIGRTLPRFSRPLIRDQDEAALVTDGPTVGLVIVPIVFGKSKSPDHGFRLTEEG